MQYMVMQHMSDVAWSFMQRHSLPNIHRSFKNIPFDGALCSTPEHEHTTHGRILEWS